MSHDVFISYSTKDKTIADAVCARLEESKIRAWIAPRDVPAGANFAESIINAIDTSKVFILIWSANTNTSEHILTELNQAFDQGIMIIPFRIQDVQPTSAMRYYIGRTHWLDAFSAPNESIDTLVEIIRIKLGWSTPALSIAPVEEKPSKEEADAPIVVSFEPKAEKPLPMVNAVVKPQSHIRKPSRRKLVTLLLIFGFIMLGIGGLFYSGVLKNVLPTGIFGSTPTATIKPTKQVNSTITLTPTITVTPSATPNTLVSDILRYAFPNNFKEHRYLYVTVKKGFYAVFDYCKAIGAHLVEIDSESENSLIFDLTAGNTWIGATDHVQEGVWNWASGRLMDYTNWGQGQPDNNQQPDGEDCTTFFGNPSWNDVYCNNEYGFVCEWDQDK